MGAITLLDGGMGQELINRGAPRSEELWSAWARWRILSSWPTVRTS